jgi:hypothetical protein
MSTLTKQFERIGARLKIQDPGRFQQERARIDVGRDRDGEFFDLRCQDGAVPEVIDALPGARHLVLMVRDGKEKNKFLLGHDERHWFAAAVPGASVRDVRTAIDSLRPEEAGGGQTIRQGEWFFKPAPDINERGMVVYRNEPLSRGVGSKPHICEELMRRGGVSVMISRANPTGVTLAEYSDLIATDPKTRSLRWNSMVRDAEVFARGYVRHGDHKTIHLDGWHRVYMNRERFAKHAKLVAFLD